VKVPASESYPVAQEAFCNIRFPPGGASLLFFGQKKKRYKAIHDVAVGDDLANKRDKTQVEMQEN
jgi:hypothetical protein